MKRGAKFFTAMPNDGSCEHYWDNVVQPIAGKIGATAVRLRTVSQVRNVLQLITKTIDESAVFLAFACSRNSNVYLELGYAIAANKPCVVIINDSETQDFFAAYATVLDVTVDQAIFAEQLERTLVEKLQST